MIGQNLAGETEIDVILGANDPGDAREQLRLLVAVPHDLEDRVGLAGKTAAGRQIPGVPVDPAEETLDLLDRPRVRPYGDILAEQVAGGIQWHDR